MDKINQLYHAIYKERDDTSKSVSASRAATRLMDGETQVPARLSLQAGDLFSGEVTDVQNQSVHLRLANGQELQASLCKNVSVNIGDTLQFLVREAGVEQLILQVQPNQEQSQMSAIAERALLANGFSLSEKNGQIAMALIQAGEPVDKANIMRLVQQSYRLPEADIHTLVALNKANIPVNETNLAQYERYCEGTHQLSNQIIGLADTVVSAFAGQVTEQSPDQTTSLQAVILEMIDIHGEAPTAQDTLVKDMVDAFCRQSALTETAENGQAAAVLPEEKIVPGSDAGAKDGRTMETSVPFRQVFDVLVKEGYAPDQVNRLLSDTQTAGQLLSRLSVLSQYMREENVQMLQGLSDYQSLMKKGLVEAWTMNPEKLKKASGVDEYFEQLGQDLAKLSAALKDSKQDGQAFQRQSGQLQEQMKFMQDINQNYIYTQIPVKLSEQVANSELYVYADRKKLAQKQDAASVLFHLDMEHLGATDVHVTLANHQVHAVFTLEDRKSIALVAEHMQELDGQLEKLGLQLRYEVKKKPQPLKSPVVEEIVDPDAEKSVKRYNFDVRM